MPDTAFAAWQERTGLTRAVDAARALGCHLVTVHALRRGIQKPSSPMRRLMAILEAHPGLIERESSVNPSRRRKRESGVTGRLEKNDDADPSDLARIRELLPAAIAVATPVGPTQGWWDMIVDGKQLLAQRPTLLSGTRREVAEKIRQMLEEFVAVTRSPSSAR